VCSSFRFSVQYDLPNRSSSSCLHAAKSELVALFLILVDNLRAFTHGTHAGYLISSYRARQLLAPQRPHARSRPPSVIEDKLSNPKETDGRRCVDKTVQTKYTKFDASPPSASFIRAPRILARTSFEFLITYALTIHSARHSTSLFLETAYNDQSEEQLCRRLITLQESSRRHDMERTRSACSVSCAAMMARIQSLSTM
jgi:hypothetical protein